MTTPQQIAKALREVYFGGNWTASNLKNQIHGVTWQQATTKIESFNTIATLMYHLSYYVTNVIKVLKGGPLEGNDKLSFDHPSITSDKEWQALLAKIWREAEEFAALIEVLPEGIMVDNFTDKKYGDYYRNLQGIVEHIHYHLGQIVILKKLLPS